ncbi:flagellar assembly protein FliH [Listeria ivanovii]|uniref:FliH/SctL family protein n=1 Tax=Listeria ivanovii TaxID=1638 RepID=UPI000DA70666|nr:FliH/SctL family protein [Listeria ivanovii]PZF91383.1 flagellar assembly protein FliH [Listeria ivanovii]PZF96891.1 flagellar assembly protein FliH [Listeria ivanovii]PZG06862.1 flagellar assembly protein FliH [Listeria ivanovii]PZG11897.1 flagellar assembly protein FliH [Listeria ivanovii]PZG29022.1 flagellar assembly protein FliH [Listeria ivanovii]
MSLSNPRIPKTDVTLSDVKMELIYLDEISETEEQGASYAKELEQLEHHQKELEKYQSSIEMEQQKLTNEKAKLAAERAEIAELKRQAEAAIEQQKVAWQQEKAEIYEIITDFLWDESIDLAEKIVHQAIDTRQIEVLPILTEVIQKLPVAFDKLNVTTHPETLKALKEENTGTKYDWLLENIHWNFDMRLDYGEFTVEEEKEYFDYRITEIFQTLHKQNAERKILGGDKA